MKKKRTKEEVKQLWDKFIETGDQLVRDELILQYLHLVKYVVGKLGARLPNHVRSEDLFSTGVIGLVKAIEKYDNTKNNKFETYAILLIRGAIIDEMRSLDWVPRSVHQKANLISDTQEALEKKLGREATDAEVAKSMNLSLTDYDALVERVRPAVLLPLDLETDQQGEKTSLAEKIPDDAASTSYENLDRNEFRQLLKKAVEGLPEQEQSVLVLYYFENMMLKQIGKLLGVSESRISQIHTKALIRLKGRLERFMSEYVPNK